MAKNVELLFSFRVSLKYLRTLRVRQGREAKTSIIFTSSLRAREVEAILNYKIPKLHRIFCCVFAMLI